MGFFKRIGLKVIIPSVYFVIGLLYLLILWAGAKYAFGTIGYYYPIPYFVFFLVSFPGLAILALLNIDNLLVGIVLTALIYAGIGWLFDALFFQKNK
jgi:hypothetical protein